MKRNKNDYENLYEEYEELKAKTIPIASTTPGKVPYKGENIKYHLRGEDTDRLTLICKELLEKYRNRLSFEDKNQMKKLIK